MRTIDITPRTERPRSSSSTVLAACFAFGLFTLVGWRFATATATPARAVASVVGSSATSQAAQLPQEVVRARMAELEAEETAQIQLFLNSAPGVVQVANVAEFRNWRRDAVEIPQGTGTGFVWDARGHIVTNSHVVFEGGGRQRLYVTFASEREPREAEVVGLAPHQDLAVLRLIGDLPAGAKPLPMGLSGNLLVGQNVYAIGNPFGLDQTLTKGIISGLGREIRSPTRHKIANVIQTDAAINPGNSGGPLLDSAGKVIGVNTAIVSPSGAYAGIGFAVPVDVVNRIVPELIEKGVVTRPGLNIRPLDDQTAARFGLRGVGIEEVVEGGAAARAGLRSAAQSNRGVSVDEILAIDDAEIRSTQDLYDALDARAVGDTVSVTFRRDGEVRDVRVKLQAIR